MIKLDLNNNTLVPKTNNHKHIAFNASTTNFERVPADDTFESKNKNRNLIVGLGIATIIAGLAAAKFGLFSNKCKNKLQEDLVVSSFKERYNQAIKSKQSSLKNEITGRTHEFKFDKDGKLVKETVKKGDDYAIYENINGKMRIVELKKDSKVSKRTFDSNGKPNKPGPNSTSPNSKPEAADKPDKKANIKPEKDVFTFKHDGNTFMVENGKIVSYKNSAGDELINKYINATGADLEYKNIIDKKLSRYLEIRKNAELAAIAAAVSIASGAVIAAGSSDELSFDYTNFDIDLEELRRIQEENQRKKDTTFKDTLLDTGVDAALLVDSWDIGNSPSSTFDAGNGIDILDTSSVTDIADFDAADSIFDVLDIF